VGIQYATRNWTPAFAGVTDGAKMTLLLEGDFLIRKVSSPILSSRRRNLAFAGG
jgi:hypothetical protein